MNADGALAPAWRPALELARAAPVTLVIGDSDAGKTTLVTQLAAALAASGVSVGVVDADVGQSEIGPPTTVGLGRPGVPFARLRDAEVIALAFVGVTSPARNPMSTVVGTARMVEYARARGFERVLIDTSGFVTGDLGRALKQAKIDLVAPDAVVCLERGRECEAIVRPYRVRARPRVLGVPALGVRRSRSQDERRRRRQEALAACFAGAAPVDLDLDRVVLKSPALFVGAPLGAEELAAASDIAGQPVVWGERRDGDALVVSRDTLPDSVAREVGRRIAGGPLVRYAVEDIEGALAGLDSPEGVTLGLGWVRRLEFGTRTLTVETRVPPGEVAVVTIGRERYLP